MRITCITGHSEEVDRKFYLGHLRDSDVSAITGIGVDEMFEQLKELWPRLNKQMRLEILRMTPNGTIPSDTHYVSFARVESRVNTCQFSLREERDARD